MTMLVTASLQLTHPNKNISDKCFSSSFFWKHLCYTTSSVGIDSFGEFGGPNENLTWYLTILNDWFCYLYTLLEL